MEYTGKVHRVIDGDTIEVWVNKEKETIRLIGLDAPEMGFYDEEMEIEAQEATFTAVRELQGKQVKLELDVVEIDSYGRIQAWVFQDDKLFNEFLVEKGEAYLDTFIPNLKYQDKLIEAQKKAREDKNGLWAVDFFHHAPEEEFGLDLTSTNLEIDIPYINRMSQDDYIMARREGLGASDIPIILGQNPYQSPAQLMENKLSPVVTPEERSIGQKAAVKKGRDLEPIIIQKLKEYFKIPVWKPEHQFKFTEYPFLKINYDGVTGGYKQYFPVEVKVVTYYGEKNYNFQKAYFIENKGYQPIPQKIEHDVISIKAEHYGIPPMYYIQLQIQMLGFNAEYGYLAVLRDKDWLLNVFYVWRDKQVQNQAIIEGYKFWQRREQLVTRRPISYTGSES